MINDLLNQKTEKEDNTISEPSIMVMAFPAGEFENCTRSQKERYSNGYFETMLKEHRELKRQTGIFYNLWHFVYDAFTYKE